MKARLITKQSQQQTLAPALQKSIEVLLLPLVDLNQSIEMELQENPMLEIDEEREDSKSNILDEFINLNVKKMLDSSYSRSNFDQNTDDEVVEERPIFRTTPLEDYLMQQLRLETNDEIELKIGELIIGNLDESGYFTSTCKDVARHFGLEDPSPIQMVLQIIQNFEPIGIASRDLKECLMTQAHYRYTEDAAIICKVILIHLEDIAAKKYQKIASSMKLTVNQVKEIAKFIASLEPRPARKYRPAASNIYIKPDAFIKQNEQGRLTVEMNRDNIPSLCISKFYKDMLKKTDLSEKESEFIREKIQNGLLFIRSIEQRNSTIASIAEVIADCQKDFFELGHLALKPMTLKNVAEKVDRNESTISRAISNKYIDTPQGLLPMKFFFSQGVEHDEKGSVTTRSIKEQIKELVEDEDKTSPLSDMDIQQYFEHNGTQIARRTISKYRKSLRILPSHLRKS